MTRQLSIFIVAGIITITSFNVLVHGSRRGVMVERPENSAPSKPLALLATLQPFTLLDQNTHPFTLDSMKGHVTVVDFFFTTCPGICPLLTQHMSTLERNTRELGDKVHFLSISVDPDTDIPPVMKDYATKRGLDLSRWSFVVGPLQSLEKVVIGGFKSQMARTRIPASDGEPELIDISHSQNFIVVDRDGQIRAFQPVGGEKDLEAILKEVESLVD